MKTLDKLSISKVNLDSMNPRHTPLESQTEIIEYMLSHGKIKELAKDIVSHGISPLESLAVIELDLESYVAIEGNRRVCALILLNNPKRCPTKHQSYFEKLAKNQNFPHSIRAIVFDSRNDANIWIERRHFGAQNGVGTLQWNAPQKSRWKRQRKKSDPNALALTMLEHARTLGFISSSDANNHLTTATRYFSNPKLRQIFGIVSKSNDPKVMLDVEIDEFNRILQHFCTDLAGKDNKVSSRSNKTDRENYAERLSQQGLAPTSKCAPWKFSKEVSTTKKGKNGNGKSQKRRRRSQDPDNRKHLVTRIQLNDVIDDKFLKRSLKELCTLNVDNYPLATTLVCRAFLERVYRLYHEKAIGPTGKKKVHLIMKNVIEQIKNLEDLSESQSNALSELTKIQNDQNKAFSPRTLGANAHLASFPIVTDLKRQWDNIEHIVQYMIARI